MSSIFGKNYDKKKENKAKTKKHNDIESHVDEDIDETIKAKKKKKTKKKEYHDHDVKEHSKNHHQNNKFTESDSDDSIISRDEFTGVSREGRARKYRLIVAVSCVVIISCIFGVLIFLMIFYYPRSNNDSPTSAPVTPPTQACKMTPAWGQQDDVYVYNTFSRGYNDITVGSYVYPCVKNNGNQIMYVDSCNPFVLIYNSNGNEYCNRCFQYCDEENLAPVYPGNTYCASGGFQLQATGGYSVKLKYARYCQNYFFSSCSFVSSAGSMSFCVV